MSGEVHTLTDLDVGQRSTLLHPGDGERRGSGNAGDPGGEVEAGTRLGRYVVLERLGAGGMGVVYTAWDPQLDRKLALKLLHLAPDESGGAGQARLQREAQALARLEHANVVTIHDVGTVADRVFLAMEFVEGQSLGTWVRAEARSWRELLAVFVDAGRGLAAAHEVGLVHRDFKPDNVMVGLDGRVRVLDFGLARSEDGLDSGGASDGDEGGLEPGSWTASNLGSLTRTGVLVGTPAYMSPEQFACQPLDARSDQFSFCVALWEALCGERPYAGSTLSELLAALEAQRRRPFTRAGVPEPVVRALERGLAAGPAARWPSMVDLLAVLESALVQPKRSRLAWLSALGLAVGVGVGAGQLLLDDRAEAQGPIDCRAATQRRHEVWDPGRAQALERSLAAAATEGGEESGGDESGGDEKGAGRVRAQLASWLDGWADMVEETCVTHHHRHEQSAELFDLRMGCLERRLRAFDGFVTLVIEAQLAPAQVERALASGEALAPVDECADPEFLRQTAPPSDPALADEVRAVEDRIDRNAQLIALGDFAGALEGSEALRPQLEALAHPPLWASYWCQHGMSLVGLGRWVEMLDAAAQALAAAQQAGAEGFALEATLLLARGALYTGALAESRRWLVLAEALAEEVEDPGLGLEVHKARAFLAMRLDEPRVALEASARAVEIVRASGAEGTPAWAAERSNYAYAAGTLAFEDPELARSSLAAYGEILAILAESLDPMHPSLLATRANYAQTLLHVGELERGLAEVEALPELGPDHFMSDTVLRERARALALLGRCELARDAFERHIAWLRAHPADPGRLVQALILALDRCAPRDQALELAREAVALGWPVGAQPQIPEGLRARLCLALLLLEGGELEAAEAELARSRVAVEEPRFPLGRRIPAELAALEAVAALAGRPPTAAERVELEELREGLDPFYGERARELLTRALDEGS